MKLRHPGWLRLLPPLGAALLRGIFATCRLQTVNEAPTARLLAQGQAVLYTVWHAQLLYTFHHFRNQQGVLLASPSFDGELIGRIARHFGFLVFYGSRRKGGLSALKEMSRLIRRGHCAGIIADGSRGPRHQVQKGVVLLAREAGAPIVPLAVAATRKLVLPTWDRFELILPGSRVALLYGEPIWVPATARWSEMARLRVRVEDRLRSLFARSERFFPR